MSSAKLARSLPRSDALTRLSRNTIYFMVLNVATALFSFLISVIIGRGLGAGALGQYSLALAWSLTLAQFADFGMNTLLTRELAQTPAATPRYLTASLVAKTVLGLALALFLLVFAPVLAPQPETAAAIQLSALLILLNAWFTSFLTVFRAFGRATPILVINTAGLVLQTALTFFMIAAGFQVYAVILLVVILQAVQCLAAAVWFKLQFHFPERPASPDLNFILQLLRRALPFAIAGILGALELRANIFLLGWLQDEQAVGYYSAASRITDGLRLAPNAFFGALLPALALLSLREHASDTRHLFRRARWSLLAFGFAAAVTITLLAQPLMEWTYGAQFESSRTVLIVLAWGLIPALALALLILLLYAQHQERVVNLVLAIGLALHVGLAIPLIISYSAVGAAAAALLSDLVVWALLSWRAAPYLRTNSNEN